MGAPADIRLARPAANTRRTEHALLFLIVLWHYIVFLCVALLTDWWPRAGPLPSGFTSPEEESRLVAAMFGVYAVVLLTLAVVEGLVGWAVCRLYYGGDDLNTSVFVRAWWRACLWSTIALPVLALIIGGLLQSFAAGVVAMLFGPLLLVVSSTWLVQFELGQHRRSRWQPECPECGYPLRHLTEPRCPECGARFPTAARTFRRWAVRRLAWDRSPRGALLAAYIVSLVTIVVLPAKAARSLAIPDRWPRCGRWAAVHVLLTAFIATLLGSNLQYVWWLVSELEPPMLPPELTMWVDRPGRVALWAAQSFLAWSLPLLLVVAIACLISVCTPGRHRAAKLGGAKWTLYLTVLFLLTSVGWYAFHFVCDRYSRGTAYLGYGVRLGIPPPPPMWLFVAPYGVWWAIGMAVTPYNRRRKPVAPLVYAAIFFGSWLLAAYVLFPAGPLEALR